jgi:hypothetical protein
MEDMIAPRSIGCSLYEGVRQTVIGSWEEFQQVSKEYEGRNLEGFMLLNPRAQYKHGKGTVNQGILLKYKYYSDPIDARIYGIEARKELTQGVKRSRNVLGLMNRVNTQGSYNQSNIGGTLWVQLKDGSTAKIPFPKNLSLVDRKVYYEAFGKGSDMDLKDTWVSFRRLSCEDGDGAIAVKEVEFRD